MRVLYLSSLPILVLSGSCASTIPGTWTCASCKSPSSYYWANRSIVFDTSSSASWRVGHTILSADNATIATHYDNGRSTTGAIAADCASISYSDKSRWAFAGGPAGPPIRVHIAPHTHDDVGWDEAYMQYYDGSGPLTGRNVTRILTAVVSGLLANPARRFVYVEQAYFAIFYETAAPAMQASIRALVASGQLVFLNGGWSMHDEANPTYTDMLDNTAVGHRFIRDTFGESALPTLTWQIDPFGHSAFQGVLSSALGGYLGVMWGREPADFKESARNRSSLERVWLPSPSLGGAAAGFQGIFWDKGYAGPDELSGCRAKGSTNASCGAKQGTADAAALAADLLSRSPLTRGRGILINVGGDFTWENAVSFAGEDMGNWFEYLDAVIAALNADPQQRFNASYSTAAEYVREKVGSVTSLPPLVGDLFPYNDDTQGHNMWAGYFTSRPAFKGFVRSSSAAFNSARQLQVLAGAAAGRCDEPPASDPSSPLFTLERAMGVAQHHDAVSGTAKEVVNGDYSKILSAGLEGASGGVARWLAVAAGGAPSVVPGCALANVTICPPLEGGEGVVVFVHNALGVAAGAPPANVVLPVGLPPGVASYAVSDAKGGAVVAQLLPLSPRDLELRALYKGDIGVNVMWLAWQGFIPPAGFSTFFLTPAATESGAPHTHPSAVARVTAGDRDPSISNGIITLNMSSTTGFVSGWRHASGVSVPLVQSWRAYEGANGTAENGSNQASGAYIFRPIGVDAATISGVPTLTLITGPVVCEARSELTYVTQATRLWAGYEDVEFEWTVGPVDSALGPRNVSKEVIARYETGLPTGGEWATDANCREAQPRRRGGWRANWTAKLSETVSGNYFPTNCLVRATGAGLTLAIAVDRSQGGSSLADGALELMVHRRMKFDDHRGVAEALDEPGLDGRGLIVKGRHWLLLAPAAGAPPSYKALQLRSLALPVAAVGFSALGALTPTAWRAAYKASASLLADPQGLPPNLHLTTVHLLNATTLLLRLTHVYDKGEHALSADASVDLSSLFGKGLRVASAVDYTLPGGMPLVNVAPTTFTTDGGDTFTVPVLPVPPAGTALTVTLAAGEVRTFMCTATWG